MEREDFAKEFIKRVAGRSDVELARLLHVSIPTIDRYKRGVSSPHPLGQQSMLDVMVSSHPIRVFLRKAA